MQVTDSVTPAPRVSVFMCLHLCSASGIDEVMMSFRGIMLNYIDMRHA